jgi:hypothetical protein
MKRYVVVAITVGTIGLPACGGGGGASSGDGGGGADNSNRAPVAIADMVATLEDTPVTTPNLLANDVDLDGDALAIQTFTATSAQGGTVTDTGSGALRYSPSPGFRGTDTFTYTVVDSHGSAASGTVSVQVARRETKLNVNQTKAFGTSVAISGDFFISGSRDAPGNGGAYVYARDPASGTWAQQAKLVSPDPTLTTQFGIAVGLNGTTAVVGALGGNSQTGSGAAYVYARDATGAWIRQAKLTPSDPADGLEFGASVATTGATTIVGVNPPAFVSAYVYTRDSGTGAWVQQAKLVPCEGIVACSASGALSVALSGNTAVLGATAGFDSNRGVETGAAYVFVRVGGAWIRQAELVPSDGVAGDQFGTSVAISSDTIVVGSKNHSANVGAAYVFVRSGNNWTQQAKLLRNDTLSISFGSSVGIDGDRIVVGAIGAQPTISSTTHVFARSGNSWQQQGVFVAPANASGNGPNDTANLRGAAFLPISVSVSGDTAVSGASWDDEVAVDAGAVYAYLLGGSLNPTIASPPDPDRFLTFRNPASPLFIETRQTAEAYYQAIDPLGEKTTLGGWMATNRFAGSDPVAVYLNNADLGFGRRMSVRTNPDDTVASCVENYPTIGDAISRANIIATVCMEYGPPANDPAGKKFTKFYTFGADGNRVLEADLDGRGAKYLPGLCNVCHGGQPKALANGIYPDFGNTGAGFLPWDLDTFRFSQTDAAYTRQAQEAQLKEFNRTVLLKTEPTPATKELIEGWYGGPGLPSTTFNGSFVPPGWAGNENLYHQVVAPHCRACHIQRGSVHQSDIDFANTSKFFSFGSKIGRLVYDEGVMPLAKRTFDNFWQNPSNPALVLGAYLGGAHLIEGTGEFRRLGRPVADPGPSREAPLGMVKLDGTGSFYASSYAWSFFFKPGNSRAAFTDTASPQPTFIADVAGQYIVRLEVTGANGEIDARNVSISASGAIAPASFETHIRPIFADCVACHRAGSPQQNTQAFVRFDVPSELYQRVKERIELTRPLDSLILTKPLGAHHAGGTRSGFTTADRTKHDLFLRWITEGALEN